MSKALLLKIKSGKEEIWENWCKKINGELHIEAIESLREEKVKQELVISFKIEDSTYSLAFIEGEGLPSNLNREINTLHKKIKSECIESVSDAHLLYNVNLD